MSHRPGSIATARRAASLVLAALVALCSVASAQAWKPTRPAAFIVGAAPGGSIDLTARLIQNIWSETRIVGTPVIVINKPGAGNGIAWEYLNERGADGHAIAIGTTNLVSNPVIGLHRIGWRDVTPLAMLFDDYMVLAVKSDSPLRSMRDVADRLRKDPAALSIAFAPGLGAGSHTAAAVAVKATGARVGDARFVVYKSAGEALASMLGGEIDIVSATSANIPPFLQSGRVRVLAVTAPQRLGGALAQVPTLKEQGFDAVFTNWRAVIGPKGMRREHVAFWEDALSRVTQSDAWRRELERNFWTANFVTGPAAREFMERSSNDFRELWASLGIKPRPAAPAR